VLEWEKRQISPEVSDPILGTPLIITLSKAKMMGDVFNLTIFYSTTSQGSALSWLTPEQTAGKKYLGES